MMDCGARPGGDREGYSTERSRAGTIATPALTRSLLMTHHHLHSSPETCHWGFFEAKLKPVLAIASGDEVTIDTISGGPECRTRANFTFRPNSTRSMRNASG